MCISQQNYMYRVQLGIPRICGSLWCITSIMVHNGPPVLYCVIRLCISQHFTIACIWYNLVFHYTAEKDMCISQHFTTFHISQLHAHVPYIPNKV